MRPFIGFVVASTLIVFATMAAIEGSFDIAGIVFVASGITCAIGLALERVDRRRLRRGANLQSTSLDDLGHHAKSDLLDDTPVENSGPASLVDPPAVRYGSCGFCGSSLSQAQKERTAQYCSVQCLEFGVIDRQQERFSNPEYRDSAIADDEQVMRDRRVKIRQSLPQIIERDGAYCCMRWGKGCGQPLSPDLIGVETDHIVPISRFYALRRDGAALPEIVGAPDLNGAQSLAELDGPNDVRNLAALCARCNSVASNLTSVELKSPNAERSITLGILSRDEIKAIRLERWRVTGQRR